MTIERSTLKNQMIATLNALNAGEVTEKDVANYITDIIWSYQESINEHAQLIQALQAAVRENLTEDIIRAGARSFIDFKGLQSEFQAFLEQSLNEKGSDVFGPVQ